MGAGTPMAGAGFQPSRLLSAARALAPAPHINHNHTATCDTKHHFIPQGPPWNRPSALLEPPMSLPRFPLIPKEAPRGGGPQCRGVRPPLRDPSGAPPDPFLSPRFGTGIGTASGTSCGSTPLRHRTGRGAPEQVNYRVNSMSTIPLLGRSVDAPGPLLESQPAPLGAIFRDTSQGHQPSP